MIPSNSKITKENWEEYKNKQRVVGCVCDFLMAPPGAEVKIPEELNHSFMSVLGEVTAAAIIKMKENGEI